MEYPSYKRRTAYGELTLTPQGKVTTTLTPQGKQDYAHTIYYAGRVTVNHIDYEVSGGMSEAIGHVWRNRCYHDIRRVVPLDNGGDWFKRYGPTDKASRAINAMIESTVRGFAEANPQALEFAESVRLQIEAKDLSDDADEHDQKAEACRRKAAELLRRADSITEALEMHAP